MTCSETASRASVGGMMCSVCVILLLVMTNGAHASNLSSRRALLADGSRLFGSQATLSQHEEGVTERRDLPLFHGTGGPLLRASKSGPEEKSSTPAVLQKDTESKQNTTTPAARNPPQDSNLRAPDLPRLSPKARPATAEQANMQAALAEQAAQKGIAERDAVHVEAQRTAKSRQGTQGLLLASTAENAADNGRLEDSEIETNGTTTRSSPLRPISRPFRLEPGAAAALRQLEARLAAAGVAGIRTGGSPGGPNPVATQGARVDSQRPAWDPPEPHLFFLDQDDGSRLLIWSPNDTLPRDVARRRRPEVWLYCFLNAEHTSPAALMHFLEHYSRHGVSPERMLFVLQQRRVSMRNNGGNDVRYQRQHSLTGSSALAALLRAWGVDFRVRLGAAGPEARLRHRLEVLRSIPVHDWILLPDADELFDFGNFTAAGFLGQRDADGTNWVEGTVIERVASSGNLEQVMATKSIWAQFSLGCKALVRQGGNNTLHTPPETKVVAHKGFWRTTADGRHIVQADSAAPYFGRQADCESAGDLFSLTPYDAYWKYYRARLMTGNSYLWEPRRAEGFKVWIHRFRWHADTLGLFHDEMQAAQTAACVRKETVGANHERTVEELSSVVERLQTDQHIDVAGLRCAVAHNPFRFPLPAIARGALLATRF